MLPVYLHGRPTKAIRNEFQSWTQLHTNIEFRSLYGGGGEYIGNMLNWEKGMKEIMKRPQGEVFRVKVIQMGLKNVSRTALINKISENPIF